MRIVEIIGDDENIVYNKLRDIRFIISAYSMIPAANRNGAIEKLFQDNIDSLNEDTMNLINWKIISPRIASLHSEINSILNQL